MKIYLLSEFGPLLWVSMPLFSIVMRVMRTTKYILSPSHESDDNDMRLYDAGDDDSYI